MRVFLYNGRINVSVFWLLLHSRLFSSTLFHSHETKFAIQRLCAELRFENSKFWMDLRVLIEPAARESEQDCIENILRKCKEGRDMVCDISNPFPLLIVLTS